MPGLGYGDAEYTLSPSNDIALSEGRVVVTSGLATATATAPGSMSTYVNLIVALAAP